MLAYSSTEWSQHDLARPPGTLSRERRARAGLAFSVSQRLSPYQNAAVGLIEADAELHAGYV
jgi:hypothetical protein